MERWIERYREVKNVTYLDTQEQQKERKKESKWLVTYPLDTNITDVFSLNHLRASTV